ncbi:excalibur calcium-binding domain-containing protein [Actinomyces viscosus]|uniref:excalibur calcium-binding domain-containing protein n=1 Tax=Actinomyces viscosus TaxID=1656 RepID=UPI000F830C39|nr:excalibur calcium-binding domain-containing protein [Actinomyces viscosus]TFH51839.1 excalibur calcium-binding domain-containing protein [Actinomyces viscosus]
MQESEPTSEPEATPEEETRAGGGAAAPAPVPEPEITYYPICKKAKAAGAAPLYRGDPGYREELDRDRDGIACEIK